MHSATAQHLASSGIVPPPVMDSSAPLSFFSSLSLTGRDLGISRGLLRHSSGRFAGGRGPMLDETMLSVCVGSTAEGGRDSDKAGTTILSPRGCVMEICYLFRSTPSQMKKGSKRNRKKISRCLSFLFLISPSFPLADKQAPCFGSLKPPRTVATLDQPLRLGAMQC